MALGVVATLFVHAQEAGAEEQPFVATGHAPTQGTPVPGQYLFADFGTWSAVPVAYDFQWLRDGVEIPGAESQGYLVQPGDIGHVLTPYVTGHRGDDEAHFTGTSATARQITSAVKRLRVHEVQVAPTRKRTVWAAVADVNTEAPWTTDGATTTAYKKKHGKLKPLGTGVVTRGTAVVKLWNRVPEGRTKVVLCFAGTDVVAASCSRVDAVQG